MILPRRVTHVMNDIGFGGVSKALALYDAPELADVIENRHMLLNCDWALAPVLDADVIMLHFPPTWRALLFLATLRVRNPSARIIHVAHSYTRAFEVHNVASLGRFRRLLRLALRLVDDVVAVSEAQAVWLREAADLSVTKCVVITPWSGAEGLGQIAISSRGSGPLQLGAIGRFDRSKGFDILIDAMRQLPPAQFRLRLGGFGPQEVDLRARAGDLPHVQFAGRIDDVASFFGGCDAIVVPSRWESFGLVVTEAKFAGRPVVVSAVDGLPEQVGQAGLIVDCTTAEALANALRTLPGSPLQEMARKGRASIAGYRASRLIQWRQLLAG